MAHTVDECRYQLMVFRKQILGKRACVLISLFRKMPDCKVRHYKCGHYKCTRRKEMGRQGSNCNPIRERWGLAELVTHHHYVRQGGDISQFGDCFSGSYYRIITCLG